jgi:hypothetical protein
MCCETSQLPPVESFSLRAMVVHIVVMRIAFFDLSVAIANVRNIDFIRGMNKKATPGRVCQR